MTIIGKYISSELEIIYSNRPSLIDDNHMVLMSNRQSAREKRVVEFQLQFPETDHYYFGIINHVKDNIFVSIPSFLLSKRSSVRILIISSDPCNRYIYLKISHLRNY